MIMNDIGTLIENQYCSIYTVKSNCCVFVSFRTTSIRILGNYELWPAEQ